MKRRATGMRTALVAAFVALACGFAMVALVRSDASEPDVPTQVVPVKSDPPGSPRTLERLTPRQRRQARRILTRDTRFRQVVDPHAYRLLEIVPWGTVDKRRPRHREVFIGTFARAVLKTPKPSVVADWPLVDYPSDKRPNYRIRTLQLTVRGLRSMFVHIDLKRRNVASFSPFKADEVIYPPDYTPPPPKPH